MNGGKFSETIFQPTDKTMEQSEREKFIREAKRIEEDSLLSSKGHFYAAQFWTNIHLWIGIPTAVLAAIAGGSALSQFDYHELIAGILALVAAALIAIATFLNPNERAATHLRAGNQYNALRNNSRIFHEINMDGSQDSEKAIEQIGEMNERRNNLNQTSPQIPKWFFDKARKGIEKGEAQYAVDQASPAGGQ